MAEEKTTVVIYVDWGSTFDKLDEAEAGRLIKHFFDYVRDKNPTAPDRLTAIAFEPVKRQLKRDLKKWEGIKDSRSDSGKLGNLKRWNKDLYANVVAKKTTLEEAIIIANDRKASHPVANGRKRSQTVANIAVNDNVTVNGNVINNHSVLRARTQKFYDSLKPHLEAYGKDMLREFFEYWTEPNKSSTQFKQEMEKTWDTSRRLKSWAKRDFGKGKGGQSPSTTSKPNQITG